ncbi:MAG: B12-binding domain-containing radical SAM protein, partial [Bacteroidales bacterium]
MENKKILLINPKHPDTYWSFKYALKFVSKKAANPSLGLLTVASLLPSEWEKKLIDLNIKPLKDKDILWSDYIFVTAMSIQQKSVKEIVYRCRLFNKKIVAGGPLFTEDYENFSQIDYFILNEAEITLPLFLNDLKNGSVKKIYQTSEYADLTCSPIPDYSLIDTTKYAFLSIQFTRGCPYDCEFCDITALLGHKVRTKTSDQVILELQNLYETGWRSNVFFVDDNFIGKKNVLKRDLLPSIIKWMQKNKYPFMFTTEVSIDLADDVELMHLMVEAGFSTVFIGIETPEEASLTECNKKQNKNRDLIQSVKDIQSVGLEVSAGFIVGFDNDSPSVFQRQIDFIQNSSIISAMVGLLNAPKKTKLYQRLLKEGRIVKEWSGNNTDYSLNFIPAMKKEELLRGYKKIIRGIYSRKAYYSRVISFLKDYNPRSTGKIKVTFSKLLALLKSIYIIGILSKSRKYYWNLFFWTLFSKPKLFPLAITYSI